MSSNRLVTDLCPKGYWLEIRKAINIVGDGESNNGIEVDKKNFRKRADLDESLFVEHGRDSKVDRYKQCEFVYVSKPGTRASASLGLTLSKWCRLNEHLSNETNWTSLNKKIKEEFKEYTGVEATPDNIRLCFGVGVLTTSQEI